MLSNIDMRFRHRTIFTGGKKTIIIIIIKHYAGHVEKISVKSSKINARRRLMVSQYFWCRWECCKQGLYKLFRHLRPGGKFDRSSLSRFTEIKGENNSGNYSVDHPEYNSDIGY